MSTLVRIRERRKVGTALGSPKPPDYPDRMREDSPDQYMIPPVVDLSAPVTTGSQGEQGMDTTLSPPTHEHVVSLWPPAPSVFRDLEASREPFRAIRDAEEATSECPFPLPPTA